MVSHHHNTIFLRLVTQTHVRHVTASPRTLTSLTPWQRLSTRTHVLPSTRSPLASPPSSDTANNSVASDPCHFWSTNDWHQRSHFTSDISPTPFGSGQHVVTTVTQPTFSRSILSCHVVHPSTLRLSILFPIFSNQNNKLYQ